MKIRVARSKKNLWYICVTVGLIVQMLTMMYHLHDLHYTNYSEANVIPNTIPDTYLSPMQNSGTRKPKLENTTAKSIKKKLRVLVSSEGYERARRLRERCVGDKELRPYVNVSQGFGTPNNAVQTCPIWKVGSHTLRRIFILNAGGKYKNVTNPYDIPWYYNARNIGRRSISNRPTTKRYLFIRDPYQRLLAVYIDKVLAPNTIFWWRFGIPAIILSRKHPSRKSLECGHDATFSEYAKFVIASLTHRNGEVINGVKLKRDMHYEPYVDLCKPCDVKYDFIGKMETFNTDVLDLLDDLHLNATKTLLINHGSELSAEDSIRDTAYQPFDPTFTKKLMECIGPYQALKRAWLKLQVRGLIGEKPLPVESTEAVQVTHDQFVQMAFKAREESSKAERNKLKNEHLKKYFKSLGNREMQKLQQIYYRDLQLFEYEKIPLHLFV